MTVEFSKCPEYIRKVEISFGNTVVGHNLVPTIFLTIYFIQNNNFSTIHYFFD
jgi:hypothetical protein